MATSRKTEREKDMERAAIARAVKKAEKIIYEKWVRNLKSLPEAERAREITKLIEAAGFSMRDFVSMAAKIGAGRD